jgi:hypothetical protein
MTARELEDGYQWAYKEFYTWSNIARGSPSHGMLKHQAKHFFYASGWRKFEPLWHWVIRAKRLQIMTPLLEAILSRVSRRGETAPRPAGTGAVADQSLSNS